LTSVRPYKQVFSFEKSVAILKEGIGTHFDPEMIEVFLELCHPLYEKLSGNEDNEVLNNWLDQLTKKHFD
jgi:HD-GYP domain-containing protein (c-di-GMP phosphodiesterase class II)